MSQPEERDAATLEDIRNWISSIGDATTRESLEDFFLEGIPGPLVTVTDIEARTKKMTQTAVQGVAAAIRSGQGSSFGAPLAMFAFARRLDAVAARLPTTPQVADEEDSQEAPRRVKVRRPRPRTTPPVADAALGESGDPLIDAIKATTDNLDEVRALLAAPGVLDDGDTRANVQAALIEIVARTPRLQRDIDLFRALVLVENGPLFSYDESALTHGHVIRAALELGFPNENVRVVARQTPQDSVLTSDEYAQMLNKMIGTDLPQVATTGKVPEYVRRTRLAKELNRRLTETFPTDHKWNPIHHAGNIMPKPSERQRGLFVVALVADDYDEGTDEAQFLEFLHKELSVPPEPRNRLRPLGAAVDLASKRMLDLKGRGFDMGSLRGLNQKIVGAVSGALDVVERD